MTSPIGCPDSWRLVQLKAISRKIGSGATPTGGQAAYQAKRTNYALVRSQNVFDRAFSTTGLAFVSDEQAEGLRNVWLEDGDILLNITGDGVTFARACMVPNSVLPACVNQHVSIIRLDQTQASPGYVLSYLTHPSVKAYIEAFNAGGSRRAITKGHIESFVVPLPTLNEQKAIARLLAALDDRIAILREIIATLEAIAQALFKSWFVDFDPVRAKQQGSIPEGMDDAIAALFPDGLDESELGLVPKGWQLVPFGRLLSHTIGGDWGSDELNQKDDTRVAIIRGTDIPDLRSGANSRVPIRYTSTKKLATRKLQRGDVILEVSGGSKDQPTGRSLYMTEGLLRQFDCPVEPASFCRLLRPHSENIGVLLGQHLSYIYAQGKTWEYQNQSTGIANFQTAHFLEAELVAVPSDEVLTAFASIVCPMLDRGHLTQMQRLVEIRDTLLPRLISGQLRVAEAEALVA
ncbi:restriction endonuclease subunit S [Paraburkholderia strydomiana]|uniref:restriction endonuclease subunit S n=1 Tax=Paraburkholderia strydomiana TaxID=1245417 RepID=UPI0038BA50FF